MRAILLQMQAKIRAFGWWGAASIWVESQGDNDAENESIAAVLQGWRARDCGQTTEAEAYFNSVREPADLRAWATAGLAFVAHAHRDYARAGELLDVAEQLAAPEDSFLRAVVAHGRGVVLYHGGKDVSIARQWLVRALKALPEGHFLQARICDSLGMTWLETNNFFAASEFFHRSLQLKENPTSGDPDEAGMALTHGQLGRLYMDWDLSELAETHFRKDLAIVQKLGDVPNQARMCSALGRLMRRRAEALLSLGERAASRAAASKSLDWLDGCLMLLKKTGDDPFLLGMACKDRALAYLLRQQINEAHAEICNAEAAFRNVSGNEGQAQLDCARGRVDTAAGRYEVALECLRRAVRSFEQLKQVSNVARTRLEIARTCRLADYPSAMLNDSLEQALAAAQASRRAALVREVERELEEVDPILLSRQLFARTRGAGITFPTTSLRDSERETASLLYLDIEGWTPLTKERDPQEMFLLFNELMAELEPFLRQSQGLISGYRGDGFLALFRGPDHARRAVACALRLLEQVRAFNEPRRLLKHHSLTVRTGVATGECCFGNVGTYDKMDYAARGTTANLGARLESHARPVGPCISDETRSAIGTTFRFSDDSPLTLDLKGLGPTRCWHVAGFADG